MGESYVTQGRRCRALVKMGIATLLLLTGAIGLASGHNATIGVDWGEEYVEVSIGFRGHKPDILLNDTGSRKFVNAVYLDGKTRFFDQKAAANLMKHPSKTFHKSAHLVGTPVSATKSQGVTPLAREELEKVFASSGVSFDADYTPYEFGADGEGQLYLNITKDKMVSVEEVAGHFFSYIRDIVVSKLRSSKAMKPGEGQPTILALIAIPCNYTQKQRRAIAFAAESAGMTVGGLVHGITAAATMRAFEQGPGTKKMLFYDLGSSGANVGVIEISVPENDRKKAKGPKETQVTVLSCVTMQGIGGRHHDVALAQHLRSIFESNTKIKLMPDHPNALQKLLKAANKAKIALTIADSTNVAIEGLIRNTNFASQTITRETFSQLIGDSIAKLEEPLRLALGRAGELKLEDLDGVELIGGAWRVPAVQAKLTELLKPHPLGFHLNAEEAVAMGAGYLAAAHNPFFKMKSASISDNSVHMYAIRIVSTDASHPDAIEKRSPLFKPESKLQASKSVVFKTNIDFEVELSENDVAISAHKVTGITEAMGKEENKGKTAQITLVFKADDRGIITVAKAAAILINAAANEAEAAEEGKEQTADDAAEKPGDNAEGSDQEKQEQVNKEEGPESKEAEPAKQPEKESVKPQTLELLVARINSVDAFAPEKLEATRKEIEAISLRDMEIIKLSDSKNTLESLIYKFKSAARQAEFQAACDAATMDKIRALLEEYEQWFDEDSYGATLQQIEERIAKLEEVAVPVYYRWAENEARPGLIAATNKSFAKLMKSFDELVAKKPYLAEMTEVLDAFKSARAWWDEVQQEQEALQPHEEPAFTANQIKIQLEIMRQALATLQKVPPPKPKEKAEEEDKDGGKEQEAESGADAQEPEANEQGDGEPQTESQEEGESPRSDEL
ncbi:hsp70 chaperone [Babesia caballi]|uniref:Hsp70 chaperone n=1 Tax=Babesia caballi TaxID=5871 RepID=A0AAV4LZK8_BABCB|nr:hsp70 chaperone [Babesia caballi]